MPHVLIEKRGYVVGLLWSHHRHEFLNAREDHTIHHQTRVCVDVNPQSFLKCKFLWRSVHTTLMQEVRHRRTFDLTLNMNRKVSIGKFNEFGSFSKSCFSYKWEVVRNEVLWIKLLSCNEVLAHF